MTYWLTILQKIYDKNKIQENQANLKLKITIDLKCLIEERGIFKKHK